MEDLVFDLRQLRAFVSVIDTGSFSAAGRQLNQTQSAVSQLVNSMEKKLDEKLLDRSKRPVQPTFTGRELYQYAAHILQESKQIHNWFFAIQEGKLPALRLGLVDSIVQVAGDKLLKHLQGQVKKISQYTGTAPELFSALKSGKVDLIITMTLQEAEDHFRFYPLLSERYVLVVPKGWQQLSLERLCQEQNFIAYAGWTPTGIQMQNWFKWRKLKPQGQFELDRAENVLAMVAAGYGWTLATPMFLAYRPELIEKLDCVPLPTPGLMRKMAVMCREGELENFINLFMTDLKAILNQSVLSVMKERWPWLNKDFFITNDD